MGAVVAPRFETAEHFYICTLFEGRIEEKQVSACLDTEGFARVRLIREQHVDCVICGGIRAFYRQLLNSMGVEVIDHVALSVEDALEQFAGGQLQPAPMNGNDQKAMCDIPHEDLICWSHDLFVSYGWQVFATDDSAPFAVDLIGSIDCPVCKRPVRVAICCGAHIYRCDQEIREFHDATVNDFHVRAYIYPANDRLAECCRAFGIEVIDPNRQVAKDQELRADRVPLITVRVDGHEQLAWEETG